MSIYQNLYDLLVYHIYGGVDLTADMELVTTLLATMGSIFVVAIPFLVVFFAIKTICR